MDKCSKCGFNDEEYGCYCPSYDKWYACPIENKKPENIEALKEYAERSIHDLKIDPIWYDDVAKCIKNFEIRFCRDRTFKVGDIIIFREYSNGKYTDKPPLIRSIIYIYNGNGQYGLSSDYCILGLNKDPEVFEEYGGK